MSIHHRYNKENEDSNIAHINYQPKIPNFPQGETHIEDSIRFIKLHFAINSAVLL
jgi:hypothetical protein